MVVARRTAAVDALRGLGLADGTCLFAGVDAVTTSLPGDVCVKVCQNSSGLYSRAATKPRVKVAFMYTIDCIRPN